jgi:hypothetical protein
MRHEYKPMTIMVKASFYNGIDAVWILRSIDYAYEVERRRQTASLTVTSTGNI